MPFTEAALRATMTRLATNFPASFPDEATGRNTLGLWAELLAAQIWVDDAILRRAASRLLLAESGPYLPNIARSLEYLEAARDELEREARARQPVLPPPMPRVAGRPSNAELLRHIAIGKLRARHTNGDHSWLLSDNGRNPDSHPFTAAEIDAVLAEMARRGEYESLRRLPEDAPPLDTLAAMGAVEAAAAGEWPR